MASGGVSSAQLRADFAQRVRQLFDEALEHPEGERTQHLEEQCGADGALFEAVKNLLDARGACGSFLETKTQEVHRISRYVIRGELGRGAMGVVYDAIDPMIGRPLAVKVIHVRAVSGPEELKTLNDRLLLEARSAGQLSHPGIVTIFDVGQEGNSAFIAMERIHGPSLRQVLASGHSLMVSEALRILRQTASALDHAHQHDVIHRDIKPANIMLQSDGAVKVADFGVAKLLSEHPTVSGSIVGTPSYMSPEQIEGRAVDGFSDQFSLAVLAYELVAGTRPFNSDSLATLAYLIMYARRPSVQTLKPELPATLDPVFARALSRVPAERFPTCLDFVTALEAALQVKGTAPEPVIASHTEVSERPRSKWPYALIAAVLLLCAVGFGLYRYSRNLNRLGTPSIQATSPPGIEPVALNPVVRAPPLTVPDAPSSASTKAVSLSKSARSAPELQNSVDIKRKEARPAPEANHKQLTGAELADQLYNQALDARDNGHPDDAIRLLHEAAEMGDTQAMTELGESYRTGDSVDEDDKTATLWFRRAADAGDSSGMVSLGAMYLLEDGSDAEAARWFEKAVEQGNAAAMYDLASLYETGRGVDRNTDKAKQLYRQSANLGNKEAKKRLQQLSK